MEMLAELTNIVTLFYLMFLALGIIKLRTMKEPQAGEFKVPLVPVLPLISIVVCAALMFQLSLAAWQVFGIAVVIGLAIYFFYGRHHSIVRFETKNKMNEKEEYLSNRQVFLSFLSGILHFQENRQEI